MKDTDASRVVDAFSVLRVTDNNSDMEHLQMELLKTRLELEETRNAYKQSKEETKKLKKLLQENLYQDQKNGTKVERPVSVNGADKRVGLSETGDVRQTVNNETCRCKELEAEVTSLKAVLQLRTSELYDWRRRCAAAEDGFKQMSAVHKTNSTLKFQIECLKQQLEKKSSTEQTLVQEKKNLLTSIQYESEQNRRLSLSNEELQWKLRQNAASEYRTSPLAKPVAQSSPMAQRDTSRQQGSLQYSQVLLTPSAKENLLSQSPQIYGVVEKDDSISWIIDMAEQGKEDSVSKCRVTRESDVKSKCRVTRKSDFKSVTSVKLNESSPDQKMKPNTYLTRLQKKKLLR